MADKPAGSPQEAATPTQGMPAPPSQSATQFAILGTAAEIVLVIGRSRPIFTEGGAQAMAIEWVSTFSLPPVAAKQLAQGMATAVERWEKDQGITLKVEPPTTQL